MEAYRLNLFHTIFFSSQCAPTMISDSVIFLLNSHSADVLIYLLHV